MHVFEDVCVLSTFIIKLIKRLHDERTNSEITRSSVIHYTLFENENEWQKNEPVPIKLSRASRKFPDVKTRNKKNL